MKWGKRRRKKCSPTQKKLRGLNGSDDRLQKGNCPRFRTRGPGLEEALILFFLTFNTMAGPRDRFQALGLNLFLAGRAKTIGRSLNALQRVVDQMENAPIVVALVEEEFLGVGICGLIGYILGRFFVRLSAILLGFCNQAQ